MNCVPGDLARIVRGNAGCEIQQLVLDAARDRFVRVLHLNDFGLWVLESPVPVGGSYCDLRGKWRWSAELVSIGDEFLRPIRGAQDPDDARTDEDVPVEKPTEVSACTN